MTASVSAFIQQGNNFLAFENPPCFDTTDFFDSLSNVVAAPDNGIEKTAIVLDNFRFFCQSAENMKYTISKAFKISKSIDAAF